MSDARESMGNLNERLDRSHTKFTIVRIQHGHVHDQPKALEALSGVVAVNTHPRYPHVIVLQGEISDEDIRKALGPDEHFEAKVVTGYRHSAIPFTITVR